MATACCSGEGEEEEMRNENGRTREKIKKGQAGVFWVFASMRVEIVLAINTV
jgi:hypothetical protein